MTADLTRATAAAAAVNAKHSRNQTATKESTDG